MAVKFKKEKSLNYVPDRRHQGAQRLKEKLHFHNEVIDENDLAIGRMKMGQNPVDSKRHVNSNKRNRKLGEDLVLNQIEKEENDKIEADLVECDGIDWSKLSKTKRIRLMQNITSKNWSHLDRMTRKYLMKKYDLIEKKYGKDQVGKIKYVESEKKRIIREKETKLKLW